VNKEAQTATGTVVSIWRYPVKSMLGEELNSSYITERGLIGDRAYALIDQKTGKAASAKNPRKWGKLFDFRSVFIVDPLPQVVVENIPPVRITFPDGTHIFSDQDNIDYHLLHSWNIIEICQIEPRRYKEGQRQSRRDSVAGVEYKDGRNQQAGLKLCYESLEVKTYNFMIRSQIWALAHTSKVLLLSERQLRLAKAAVAGGRI
jgi:MOSC N-terminal beta barrel domain